MQGGSAAVGMALAEPMGSGLFTTNIVFGLVVMLGAAAQVRSCCWWQEGQQQQRQHHQQSVLRARTQSLTVQQSRL